MTDKQNKAELISALRSMCTYARWQIKEGGSYHPTLGSALSRAEGLLAKASKVAFPLKVDDQVYEVAGCRFCGEEPKFVERAGDAFGFLCTCDGKRYIQTYYDPNIADRAGRIQSAVDSWNCDA